MRNSLGYLILTILIFNCFSGLSFAKGITSSVNLNYNQVQSDFSTNIGIKFFNSDRSPAVINFYTILLPFQGVNNVKVVLNDVQISSTTHKQSNGTEVVINMRNTVVPARKSAYLDISFNSLSPIDSNWGYGKLLSSIKNLNISKITFEYDNSKPKISNVDGAQYRELLSSKNRKYEFTDINSSKISFNIGNPPTFKYLLHKTYVNDSEESVINEIVIPYTDNEQQFIISNVKPTPTSQRIDKDNNIILGFLVPAQKQIVVDIEGYILKNELKINSQYYDHDLNNSGLWSLTNDFEKARISNALQNEKKSNYPKVLSTYIVDKLTLVKNTNTLSTNTFDNILRSGADSAISHKDTAIPEDYVDLLIAALRYNSIPSRMVIGILPISSIFTEVQLFHSWVEYFDSESSRWVRLDPSLNEVFGKLDEVNQSPNQIKLVVRSDSASLPKLPFLSSKELTIEPIIPDIETRFDFKFENNVITNTGNISIIIKQDENIEVLVPSTSKKLNSSTSYSILSLIGDKTDITTEPESISDSSNITIYVEIIMFVTFLTSLLLLNTIYVKIRKIWKQASH